MIQFTLKPTPDGSEPFIELNKLLKVLQLCSSGAEANVVITDGMVKVNGQTDTRKRAKLKAGDTISFEGENIEIVS